ncbi:MAG: hypothetical protein EZS28_016845 [Streblomastix strix]|uniref:Uncharacterized protein n=1 Tax=Streblomastix strix TaxID=222440 RepID=A0A5J4VYB1_9EUKA|nr:MAG: hypothetical protein EZS28_016845 [Streblomastix strix]
MVEYRVRQSLGLRDGWKNLAIIWLTARTEIRVFIQIETKWKAGWRELQHMGLLDKFPANKFYVILPVNAI